MDSASAHEHYFNAFSVDVEDYFQVSGFEPYVARERWPEFESRVVNNTHRVLDILARHGVHATFFVLGWTAERYPTLVRQIDDAGHEIGCHSYDHRLVYRMTPEEFRADLVRACSLLSDITGKPVRLYRAPSFSIVRSSLWALDVLASEGIEFDSSIFPVYHDRYGMPDAPLEVHRRDCGNRQIVEYPPAVARWLGLPLPVGGGGYFRLFPVWVTLCLLQSINRQGRRPFVVYIHPWEVDPEQPRLACGSRLRRFRHYVGLRHTERKLDRLLRSFRFGTVSQSALRFLSESLTHRRKGTESQGVLTQRR